jgi:hypothetical protein
MDQDQPAERRRAGRVFGLIVACATCSVSWDMDFDPPECVDPEHEHTINWQECPE